MTTYKDLYELDEAIIAKQDILINTLTESVAWGREALAEMQAERDEAKQQAANWRKRAKKLEQRCEDLQAGLNPETHEARGDTIDHLRRVNEGLNEGLQSALAFIDSLCEMVACDAELSDLAEECMLWRRGDWMQEDEDLKAEDQRRSDPDDPYRYKVFVVEHQGDEKVFTGFFANYDLARESVDLMVGRGCYEAWVEELQA